MSEQVEYVALRDVYVAGRYIAAGEIAELDVDLGDANRHLERVVPLPRAAKKIEAKEK
jgi:hypothetical protein